MKIIKEATEDPYMKLKTEFDNLLANSKNPNVKYLWYISAGGSLFDDAKYAAITLEQMLQMLVSPEAAKHHGEENLTVLRNNFINKIKYLMSDNNGNSIKVSIPTINNIRMYQMVFWHSIR